MQGQTLLDETKQATIVLYGKLGESWKDKDQSELLVESAIKTDGKLVEQKTKKTLLNRWFYPPENPDKVRILVFGEIYKGKADYYKGMSFAAGSKLVEYMEGAQKVQNKSVGERLKYFFEYLDNSDVQISNDAYMEFGNSDYKDFRDMAKTLPAARVTKWLNNPDTATFRLGLYASMLGHCGKAEDAKTLRALLDDPDKRAGGAADGVLAAYIMLDKKEGWDYLKGVLKDEKQEFITRFAALRAVRFLYLDRNDLVAKKDLVDAACLLLTQEDIADLAIEDLRRWQAWDRTDKVLAVVNTTPYKHSIVKRSILRFCLQCKDNKAAQQYVADRRRADPESVTDAEEILDLEKAADAKSKDKTNPGK